ncbi:MAG: hypothetical protein JRD93_01520 [Deltaproteobacteria bacterium]|nr:hypothetical protein [Deltaproteobacteria bacterium]MBW2660675.1 hypothetical protein [Deltaproteobacteria bacterium]
MNELSVRTCVSTSGEFVYGIHKPNYTVINLREKDHITTLGHINGKAVVENKINFPANDITIDNANWVFEICNPFPFMGATFILKSSADKRIENANPFKIINKHKSSKLKTGIEEIKDNDALFISLGRMSTDADLLIKLAKKSCLFEFDPHTGKPAGIQYEKTKNGEIRRAIKNHHLFEIVSNNPFLPDTYKQAMVLIPGIQGPNKIVGEYKKSTSTHIWEYLRENSYIPWGHYAANMAHDSIRYKIKELKKEDLIGLRHLYYQRVYAQLAQSLNISIPTKKRTLTEEKLESLRIHLFKTIKHHKEDKNYLPFNTSMWGWNFGFDLSPSGYRLNASHQQIHQQFALMPKHTPGFINGENDKSQALFPTYTQGDEVARFCHQFKNSTGENFFKTYINAIKNNRRMDGRKDKAKSLIFYEDENIMAFVPKAQRCQGEVQIMTTAKCGNILEANSTIRRSLDMAILTTVRMLEKLGVEMMICYETSKRFDNQDNDQRLTYTFIPRHPKSPGTYSQWLSRWIIGHYPEDFAHACSRVINKP